MKNPPHPGDLIRTEILEARGLTVSKAAKILKVSQTELSDLLQGKVDLWIRLANRIEKVFGIDAHLLLQMQSAYDLAQEADLVNRLLSFSTVDLERDRRMLAQIWEDERVHQNEQQAATPTIPLLVPRPGETLNTVQGYRFRETAKDLADIPTTLGELAKESRKRRSKMSSKKTRSIKDKMDRKLADRRNAILSEFGWATATDFESQCRKWEKQHRIFAVADPCSQLVGSVVYPLFQFADGKPLKVVKKVIEAFGPQKDRWKLALWFASNNGWLPNQARPVDMLTRRPMAVVAAAKRDAFERVTPMPPTEYHDKLIDQIVAEIENISACYWRIDACRRALPADQRAFAGEQLATIFAGLANNRKVKADKLSSLGKGNKKTPVLGLGQLKAVISSWRKAPVLSFSTIDLERDRRMLIQIWEDERVHELVTGKPDMPIAAHSVKGRAGYLTDDIAFALGR